ncbi:MAG: hypothetical protein U9N84_04495, partial [Actinomycetota bacterium]|nr:hypothetical protein [Actinomycetota bacterium]
MTHAVQEQSVSSAKAGPKWFPLNVGTALALATVLGLVTFFVTSDGGGQPVSVAADLQSAQPVSVADDLQSAQTATVEEPAAQAAGPDQSTPDGAVASADAPETASASVPVVSSSSSITNMGPTEVGYVTNFPAVEYTWERIELSGPDVSEMGWLGELNGKLVSVSPGWEPEEEGLQILVTRTSDDGTSWEQATSYELPPETWISRVVGDGEQVIAIGERWEADRGETDYSVFSTSDGVTWSVTDLALPTEVDEHVFIQDAVMGPAGIALSVQFETSPEEQPLLL